MEKNELKDLGRLGRFALLACAAAWSVDLKAVDVSFSLKIAKTTAQPQRTVVAAEMKSFSEEPDRLVWRGHPLLGDAFAVTATRTKSAVGTEWNVAYEGNGTDWFVEEVSFPEWTVPRTDRTKLLFPRVCGTLLLPEWEKATAGKVVARQGPGFGAPHLIAALGADGNSFYLDQRGDARLYSTRFEIAQGTTPDTCVLKSVCILPCTGKPGMLQSMGSQRVGHN